VILSGRTLRRIGTAGISLTAGAAGDRPKPDSVWLTSEISAGNSEGEIVFRFTNAATIVATRSAVSFIARPRYIEEPSKPKSFAEASQKDE
jgi:hypothetical protein